MASIWDKLKDAAYYGSKEDRLGGISSLDNLGLGMDNKFARPFYGGQPAKPQFQESEMDGSSGYDEYLSQGSSEEVNPREFARGGEGGFDPTNNDSVMQLQRMMGFSEEDQDGILGDQTMTALRELQGGPKWRGSARAEEGVDEFGDGYSTGEAANSWGGPVDMSGEASSSEFIGQLDPTYMSRRSYEEPEFQGPTDDEASFQAEEQDFLKTAMAKTVKRQEDPYASEEDTEMDRYDEEGNIIGGDDYKGPGSTNMTRFNDLARGMNPNLGSFLQIDRGSVPGKAYSGVNFPDNRFMQSPRESRSKLSDLIMKQLSVSRKR